MNFVHLVDYEHLKTRSWFTFPEIKKTVFGKVWYNCKKMLTSCTTQQCKVYSKHCLVAFHCKCKPTLYFKVFMCEKFDSAEKTIMSHTYWYVINATRQNSKSLWQFSWHTMTFWFHGSKITLFGHPLPPWIKAVWVVWDPLLGTAGETTSQEIEWVVHFDPSSSSHIVLGQDT